MNVKIAEKLFSASRLARHLGTHTHGTNTKNREKHFPATQSSVNIRNDTQVRNPVAIKNEEKHSTINQSSVHMMDFLELRSPIDVHNAGKLAFLTHTSFNMNELR